MYSAIKSVKALEICSAEKLSSELNKIKNILQQNGYTEVIFSAIENKIKNF